MQNEQNIIQTALQAAQQPFVIKTEAGENLLLQPKENGSWSHTKLESPYPRRKHGRVRLHDTDSLIKYVQIHQEEGTEIYIDANFANGNIRVTAVLNGNSAEDAGFGDHLATFEPKHTPAAKEWLQNNGKRMNQAEFAAFLTSQARQIVSQNPSDDTAKYPTGAEVLDFALNLEYTEKTTFKHGYREQDGRINFTFQSEDAGKNEQNLKMYEKFGIAFTPYLNGDGFFVEALLKFRIDKNNGTLVLWYELQQIHNVMEQATQTIAASLQNEFSHLPIYYGEIN